MESKNRYGGIDAYAVTKVRFQARQLARTRVFRTTDVEDLEQDLMLDLLRRLPSFDPSKASRNTFIARVVENHAATLITAAMAEKRGAAIKHESLYDPVRQDVDEPSTLVEMLSTDDSLWDVAGLGWDEAIELRRALCRAMDDLPPHLVCLCGRLTTCTVTEVARDTGMSRPSVYDAIAKVRSTLIKAGIRAWH